MKRVLITSKQYGKNNPVEISKVFSENGWEVIWNPYQTAMESDEIVNLINHYGIEGILVFSSSDKVDRNVFEKTKTLKVVSRHGVGVDNIDIKAARENNVVIRTTTGGLDYKSVADLTLGLLIALARGIVSSDRKIRKNLWARSESEEISGKTLGIIGFGRIGKAVADRAKCFGMEILVYAPRLKQDPLNYQGLVLSSLENLYTKSDFITLHCSLNPENHNMIGSQEFKKMKKNVLIINTARAALINQNDLKEALLKGTIGGYASDVYEIEPVNSDPIVNLNLDNTIFTQHIGSFTKDVSRAMDLKAALNIIEPIKNGEQQRTL